ncbi:unnamed protein product [Prorocentrum cordatum]|uniref:Peptidase M16 N-terminal domain-containing protein n=1 Tax=Prorocentrum cordatum TaxID=2364126 RepID=A0ABN9RDX6_9DINO|nr:unnamed protein product [Polarella glacialis]
MAAVTVAKPETHRREYAYVQLPNNLRAIIASDPACDKAGAALTVNVGMCYERKDLPGLAHFLEHMLFTGTKKYPKESEYSEYIKQNGGMTNANTACYVTNYMFEVKPECLEGIVPSLARGCQLCARPELEGRDASTGYLAGGLEQSRCVHDDPPDMQRPETNQDGLWGPLPSPWTVEGSGLREPRIERIRTSTVWTRVLDWHADTY